jgi:PAS domain S-box-containing protein
MARSVWFRATLALVAVYLAILPIGLVMADRQGQATAAEAATRQMERVEGDVQGLETGVLEESTGLRAYMETADPRLLNGYDPGRAQVDSAWSSLARDARGTALEARLPGLRAAIDAWQRWAAQRRSGIEGGGSAAPGGAALGEGASLLGRFQAAASGLEGQASSLASAAAARAGGRMGPDLVARTAGPIAGSTALLVLASALLWLALRPVRRLARAANRLAGGLEPEIRHAERRDEMGAVARALVSWRRAAASQRLVWQHSPVAMLVFSSDLVIRQVNPAELVLFRADPRHFTDQEYMATIVSNVTLPEDAKATARMYRRLMAGESDTERMEKRYIRADGTIFWGSVILTLIRDAQGRPDHYVCMIEDISERREKLERTARVQRDLLPESAPELEGYQLAGLCRPSREMGGDFFDWHHQEPGELTLTLGDVMGKDMPAALLMAVVRIAMRTSASLPTVGEAVRSVAASTGRDLDRAGAFVTLFHGRLDLGSGLLRYVDAGHGLMVVVGEDGVRRLPRGRSLPLGILEGQPYEELSARLEPGDALVVFSDGVLDVHPGLEERLETVGELLAEAGSAQEMAERLASGPGVVADDVTVVVLRRHPVPAGTRSG